MTKEKIVITPAITKEQLRFEVDKLVYGDGMTYTESIIEICERMKIASLRSKPWTAILLKEQQQNFIKL